MGKYVGGTWFSDRQLAMLDYLDEVLYKLETGAEDEIVGAPLTFEPVKVLSKAAVDRIIAILDEEFAEEIDKYADYHKRNAGADTTPDFYRLGAEARRKVVEGIQYIKATVEDDVATVYANGDPIRPPEPVPSPSYNPGYDMEQWC